ncbi:MULTISPECIES: AAA family ATPase [Hungatella]|uniref:cytidylate kinase-like family protein n=1 Tax=Hungatella TaxID=1649459 RepID=UPI000E5314F5|nr:cytidylate kinase-like family protein [Hungatella hathewayi]MBT9795862.1 cytidylate kinase-like family protein [Hungatella hathewayi]RGZ06255.1 cytidylate kinase-like family protein [Hungatella hathewayi]
MGHKIITIGRQFGSGGHEIGERLSKALDIPLYDRDLVEMAAEKMGLSEISVEEVDESVLNTFLSAYRYPDHVNSFTGYGLPLNDSTYLAQSSIIESLAKRGPCIIVGRCADFVLRQNPDCLNIFICADMKDRIERIMDRYHLTEKEAATAIKRTDRRRKNYYETYTDQNWGSPDSHQLLINVSKLGLKRSLDLIEYLYKQP